MVNSTAKLDSIFHALSDPTRRSILRIVSTRERTVGEIAKPYRVSLAAVSKHLKVLRQVGLVRVRRNGRHMYYRTNAEAIRPMHEWTKFFERFWQHQLDRIKERAEAKMRELDKKKEVARQQSD